LKSPGRPAEASRGFYFRDAVEQCAADCERSHFWRQALLFGYFFQDPAL